MIKRVLALVLAASLVTGGVAAAHPHVVKSDPAVGGVATTAPRTLRITFSEPVILRFTSATVKTSDGRAVPATPAALDPADPKTLIITFNAPLSAGAYAVAWRAVAADTHRVQGTFAFTVR